MIFIPDWNSADSCGRADSFCFWAGIVCFILVIGFEIASRVFSAREKMLVGIANKAQSDQQKTQIGSLQTQNDLANRRTRYFADESARGIVPPFMRKRIIETFSKVDGWKFQVLGTPGDPLSQRAAEGVAIAFRNCGWNRDETITVIPQFEGVSLGNLVIASCNVYINPKDFGSQVCGMAGILQPGTVYSSKEVPEHTMVIEIMPILQGVPSAEQVLTRKFNGGGNNWPPVEEFRERIAKPMGKYPQQPYSIYSPVNDDGADELSVKFSLALRNGPWNQINRMTDTADYKTNFGNVAVCVSNVDEQNGTVPPAANALLIQLKDIGLAKPSDGILFLPENRDEGARVYRGEITILIGLSPFASEKPPATSRTTQPESK
jgi:hypothetical protein